MNPFQVNFVPHSVFGPEIFALTALVVFDNFVGSVQDGLSGAIVLLQPDDAGIFKLLLKAQNVLNSGAAEFVDTLVVVTHNTEILVFLGKQTHQSVLGVVGVLVFAY